MAFTSCNQTVLASPLPHVYDTLSCLENFDRFMQLSPTCHSVEVLKTDSVALATSLDVDKLGLADVALNRPEYRPASPAQSPESELCTRIHFKMVERIPLLFGLFKNDVTILGTQIMSQVLKLHIYESQANNGLVQIYKLRRFAAEDQQTTKVEELISGQTSKLLQCYTQAACRQAHKEHMQLYSTVLQ